MPSKRRTTPGTYKASRWWRILTYPLIFLWLGLGITAIIPAVAAIPGNWRNYVWLAGGFIAYLILREIPFMRKNENWLEVFSHELSHTIVGLFFGRKIHSFNVGQVEGKVSYSGRRFGDFFISLAPYCLPVVTYALLTFRLLGEPSLFYIFDFLTGLTLAFYCHAFATQTGSYQSDISDQGLVRAFAFIGSAWIFNLTVIIISMCLGLLKAIWRILCHYWQTILSWSGWLIELFKQLWQ